MVLLLASALQLPAQVHFDAYLDRVGDYGLVLIDTFTDAQLNNVLRQKILDRPHRESAVFKNAAADAHSWLSLGTQRRIPFFIGDRRGARRPALCGRTSNNAPARRQLTPLCIPYTN